MYYATHLMNCRTVDVQALISTLVVDFSPGGPVVTTASTETVVLSMYQFGVGSNFWLLALGDFIVFGFVEPNSHSIIGIDVSTNNAAVSTMVVLIRQVQNIS